ncbi:hypothetical protein F0562_008714 [Nyssa sinensis]|uniref:Potassium channel domain-containing protein n=1 Tax=Nyssa sinensis TaxID=561372 RepID=A0A5J5AC68_9ASTE|nr:hypothetical protein F0562_008714 [Nyssa sinensis]
MAQNGAKQPLFSGLIDPTAQTNQSNAPKGKRLSCCGAESNGNDSLPHSEFIPGKPGPRPNFKRVAMFFSAYLSIGTACFHLIRYQMKGKKTDGVLDSVYFCVVTMTTVGYGDLVPNTVTSKLLSCGFVFTGMTIVGMFLSGAAEYLVQKQEILLVKAFHVCQTADSERHR